MGLRRSAVWKGATPHALPGDDLIWNTLRNHIYIYNIYIYRFEGWNLAIA